MKSRCGIPRYQKETDIFFSRQFSDHYFAFKIATPRISQLHFDFKILINIEIKSCMSNGGGGQGVYTLSLPSFLHSCQIVVISDSLNHWTCNYIYFANGISLTVS